MYENVGEVHLHVSAKLFHILAMRVLLPILLMAEIIRDEDCISKTVVDQGLKIPVKIVKKIKTNSCAGNSQLDLTLLFSLLTV